MLGVRGVRRGDQAKHSKPWCGWYADLSLRLLHREEFLEMSHPPSSWYREGDTFTNGDCPSTGECPLQRGNLCVFRASPVFAVS